MVLLLLLALLQAHADVCPGGPPTTVMITGFEPFDGKKQNGSTAAANAMEELNAKNPCVQYKACILPVEYENGFERARHCLENMDPKPAMVISMGEDGCGVRLETKAHNKDDDSGFTDNAGVKLVDHTIDERAPKTDELLTLPIPAMFCAGQTAVGAPLSTSLSPGSIVCNDVAYRFARYLKPKQIPFGFIHVPGVDYCKTDPTETAAKIDVMARAAIRQLAIPTSVFAKNFPHTPESGSKLNAVDQVGSLDKVVTAACQKAVRIELLKQTAEEQHWERKFQENLKESEAIK